jgi:hypothetical protein
MVLQLRDRPVDNTINGHDRVVGVLSRLKGGTRCPQRVGENCGFAAGYLRLR